MPNETCPACQGELSPGYCAWHWLCKICGYEKANLQPTINLQSVHQLIDENAREAGLRELRISNFKLLLASIKSVSPGKGRLLDVGCAHGWFLETAKNDFDVLGLEPDQNVFDAASRRGLPVRMGYFPDALNESEKFDVIVFNDVIEHIPDIEGILASCHQRLNENGLLVLNLPSSQGIFYKLSKFLCHFRICGFFDRLWQKGLPSPHLHYFNKNNIRRLLTGHGFNVELAGTLPILRIKGLFKRISYAKSQSILINGIVYVATLFVIYPFLFILPKDIIFAISRRKD